MSAKKGRGTKVLTAPPAVRQKASSDQMDFSNLLTIDEDGFLEGLQENYGNPLHSTAMEEDLKGLQKGQMDKGKPERRNIPPLPKTTAKQRGAAVKRRETEIDGAMEKKENKIKRSRRCSGDMVKARRPVKNKQMKNEKTRTSESGSGIYSDCRSQGESDSDNAQQRRKKVLSSDEEVDEDSSWHGSPKKPRVYSLGRTRKSSSDKSKSRKTSSKRSTSRKSSSVLSPEGSASPEPEKETTPKQRRKTRSRQGVTEEEVVLETFLDFCDKYKESVESEAVKQSIDFFSNNVKEQLLEKLSSYKELMALKRENAKVGSLINRKRQRLFDAKNELMRAERQVQLLQKEKTELELRLSDLRRGHAFLRDIRELNRKYLDYRDRHPKEKEMYGASSLPALLLETKHIQAVEHQLRGINNRLEKMLNGTQK
uniref:centromere protein U isoform X4 n=1 Tax=Monopterus albus TaxID=43700 RepID=UPI0009B433FC|nr:centromere protein U isoform X4 [Monopterus albus]